MSRVLLCAKVRIVSGVKVEQIDHYENMQIFDWLDEDTVIVSKDNESLGKMKLAELSDAYPRSLYLYHLDTNKFELLKERENVFMGEAALSPDKKYLLYSEFSLGDPVYYVLNLDTLEEFGLIGEPIGGAMSARWTDANDTTNRGLYVYDLLNDEATQIADGVENTVTHWSPSGESLAYTEWNGTKFNSYLVSFDF